MMAMIMARDAKNESVRCQGMSKKMIAYTSSESHYSISKNAALTGIGRENVRFVDTNDEGERKN